MNSKGNDFDNLAADISDLSTDLITDQQTSNSTRITKPSDSRLQKTSTTKQDILQNQNSGATHSNLTVKQSGLMQANSDEALNLIGQELSTTICDINSSLNQLPPDENDSKDNFEEEIRKLRNPSRTEDMDFYIKRSECQVEENDNVFDGTFTLPKIGTNSMEDLNTAGIDLDDDNFGRSSSITADLDEAVVQCEKKASVSFEVSEAISSPGFLFRFLICG